MKNLQPISWKEFHSLRMDAAVVEAKNKGEKLQFKNVNKKIGAEWQDIKAGKHDEFTLYAKGQEPPVKRKSKKHNKSHDKAHNKKHNKKHNKTRKHRPARVEKSLSAIEEHLLDLEKQLEECKKDLAECKNNKSKDSFEY